MPVPDMTLIAGAFSSLKAMKDIAEAMIGLRDATAFRERQIEFQGKIIDVQNALSALQNERSALIETIRSLEKQITDLEAWEAEKKRYDLQDVGLGSLAYVVKETMRGSEPPHEICAACYQHGKKSILQPRDADYDRMMFCPDCKTQIKVANIPHSFAF